jgi:hypothetical protein
MASLRELELLRSNTLALIESTSTLLDNARVAEITYNSLLETTTDKQLITQYQAGISQARAEIRKYTAELSKLNEQLADINAQIARLRNEQTPRDSSGAIVAEGQVARDENANTSSPPSGNLVVDANGRIVKQPATSTPSNAETANTDQTTGTDAQERKLVDTQSTPPITSRTPIQPGSPSNTVAGTTQTDDAPTPGNRPGVGAPGDDASGGGGTVRARIDDIFGGGGARIIPQANVLSKYSSYTYSISVYIMSPDNYKNLLANKTSLSGFQLLMQSGGAPLAGRNQFFPLDFYIDNVQLRSMITGRGTGGAHNTVSMKFTITEPNGITFIPNLVAATQKYVAAQGGTAPQNYAAQNFLMVIKFYGYDQNGNLVDATGSVQSADVKQSSPQAIVQKYIPFQFTSVKFKIANKLTEYECEATCPQNVIASGGARGVIPYNIELTSTTLKELLTGTAKFATTAAAAANADGRELVDVALANRPSAKTASLTPVQVAAIGKPGPTVAAAQGLDPSNPLNVNVSGSSVLSTTSSAPPKANAAPNKTLISGLTDALNRFQAELVQKQQFQYPDIYNVVIPEPIIQNAKVQPPEAAAGLGSTPMTQAQTAAQAKLGSKQSVDRNAKNVSATAGMSIVQFLDQIARTSTYITEQQTKLVTKNANGEEIEIPNGIPGKNFAWYRVGMEVEPNKYDEKRRDWTYKITYSITPYKVNDVKSDYFPQSQFTGVHKQYNYWFTGENTEILDYQQDYNYLYYIVTNTEQRPPNRTADYRSYEKRAFQPRSNESAQGAPGATFEPSASAASVLYSPGDTARVKLKILGDPGWIQQGELWSGVEGLDKFYYGPFLPDGTINYDSQEILFEVRFDTPVDYNLQTGLMKRGF